jgi:hypothetical protein
MIPALRVIDPAWIPDRQIRAWRLAETVAARRVTR